MHCTIEPRKSPDIKFLGLHTVLIRSHYLNLFKQKCTILSGEDVFVMKSFSKAQYFLHKLFRFLPNHHHTQGTKGKRIKTNLSIIVVKSVI